MLLEIGQPPVGQALDAAVPDVERRAGQPGLQLVPGVRQLADQGRVVGGGPGRGQRARAGQHGHREQHGAPRGGQRGQAGPAQPGLHRLQQRGEQQRGHARQHDQLEHAGHPEGQVERDADEQQPPAPARGALQPAGHLRARRGRPPGAAVSGRGDPRGPVDPLVDDPHPVVRPGWAARRCGRPRCGLAWLGGTGV